MKVLCDRLVTVDDKARTMYRQKGVIKRRKRHAFWWTPVFVSVELFKVANSLKQGKVFDFLKLTAEHMVFESVKRSCKKSWKVMEFE